MGKSIDGATVAPKERINIKYVPATGGQQGEVELPLTMMVVGNMKGRTEETPIEAGRDRTLLMKFEQADRL